MKEDLHAEIGKPCDCDKMMYFSDMSSFERKMKKLV